MKSVNVIAGLMMTLFLAVIVLMGVTGSASAQTICRIPESGPWPACAFSKDEDVCIIPLEGKWPACAFDDSAETTPPNPSPTECAIPESGPWPACARGGANTPTQSVVPAGSGGDCTIPPSGPWPSCATQKAAPAAPTASALPPQQTDWSNRNRIEIFDAYITPEFASPTQAPVLHWQTNADYVVVGWRTPDGYEFPCPNATSNQPKCKGTGSVSLAGASGKAVSLGAFINRPNGQPPLTQSRHFEIKCDPAAWFFSENTPAHCPIELPQKTEMVWQQFERGLMIYSTGTTPSQVYVLQYQGGNNQGNWDGVAVANPNVPRDSNPTLWAPSNRSKPLGILGSVWAIDEIREMVGWATAEPIAYEGFDQGFDEVYSGSIYLESADEMTVYALTYSGTALHWQSFAAK